MEPTSVSLFNLPEPDIYGRHIWPLLSWNDLLRIRRVCHAGKVSIDGYVKSNPNIIPNIEIEINEDKRSIEEFLQIGIPLYIKSVFINNNTTGSSLFKSSQASFNEFLKRHSCNITRLKVCFLSVNPVGKEKEFLNKFGNVKELQVLDWVEGNRTSKAQEAVAVPIFRDLVKIVSNTSTLSFTACHAMRLSTGFADQGICPNLKSLTVPFAPGSDFAFDYPDFMEKLHQAVIPHMRVGNTRIRRGTPHPALRHIRFEHIKCILSPDTRELRETCERQVSRAFVDFLEGTDEIGGFTMDMVNANWFACNAVPLRSGSQITSMLNIHPNAFQFVELEMLTRLDVITSQSTVLNHRLGEMVIRPEAWRGWTVLSTRPLWNNLESINLVIDSEELAECDGTMIDTDGNARFARYYTIPIGYLFRFLFHEQSTESLTQLTIKFEYITGWKLSLEVVQDIVTSCPNIKKLGLTNWPATNKCLTKFWEGLSELEEVTLECCKSLGNVAFVGTDIENPVFLRSAKLKTLSLLGLDQMPKISDTLFKLVLSQMRLRNLNITSSTPVTNITIAGIQSLTKGAFADSIEKFLFTKWSLQGCSSESFTILEKSFRSYNMI